MAKQRIFFAALLELCIQKRAPQWLHYVTFTLKKKKETHVPPDLQSHPTFKDKLI